MQPDLAPPVLENWSEMTSSGPFCPQTPRFTGDTKSSCYATHVSRSPPPAEQSPLLSWRISRAFPGLGSPEHLRQSRARAGVKGPEQGRQCLHSWGVYTFSGSCSSNHQALLLETLVSQAKQGSGANVVPLRELHGLDCSLAATATLSRRTSLATHLVRSRAEEPAEIHRIPGLD